MYKYNQCLIDLVQYINRGWNINQIIKRINTGSYKYSVWCKYTPEDGVKYEVSVERPCGQFRGNYKINRVDPLNDIVESACRLPESVKTTILKHCLDLQHMINGR